MKLYPQTCPINTPGSVAEVLTGVYPLPQAMLDGYIEVPHTRTAHGSPVLRSKLCATTEGGNLVTTAHPRLVTMYDYMQFAFKQHGDNLCLGTRALGRAPYTFKTYSQVEVERDAFGSGLLLIIRGLGIENHNYLSDDKDDFILTLYVPNRYEWFITDLSCIAYSITHTAIYSTLGSEALLHVLNVTRSPIIVIMLETLGAMLTTVAVNELSFIRMLIVADVGRVNQIDPTLRKLASHVHVRLAAFQEVMDEGRKAPEEHIPPQPSTTYSISFTSGTAGTPKGAVLTHQLVVAGLTGIITAVRNTALSESSTGTRRSLCILPLTHVYQRLIYFFELMLGVTIYLPTDPQDPSLTMADLHAVKPTHLVGVPRIFNRIEATVSARIESSNWVTKTLFKRAMDFKRHQYEAGNLLTQHWLYDKQLTAKIKAAMGLDEVQLIVTGSAPMLPKTIVNLRGYLNANLLQGYGLTESFACITIPFPSDEPLPDSSGFLSVTTEMKLKDCPEMGFTWKHNRSGEVFLRGPQIIQEYYKDPIRTLEAFDADGWFATGDVGSLDPQGRLRIVDRVKSMLKLAQGEYISPEYCEGVILSVNSGWLSQIFVHGDSVERFCVGILVVNEAECLELLRRSKTHNFSHITYMNEHNQASLNANRLLRQYLLNHLNANVENAKLLNSLEKVKNVMLFFNNTAPTRAHSAELNYGFTEANGLATPTLKIKRFPARKFFAPMIEEMYQEGPWTHATKARRAHSERATATPRLSHHFQRLFSDSHSSF